MRVRFSDSEQWSSPVKPPRSQNYVKPHDATTVRRGRIRPCIGQRLKAGTGLADDIKDVEQVAC
jgi:hypothetical protein